MLWNFFRKRRSRSSAPARRRGRPTRLAVEQLEPRVLLSHMPPQGPKVNGPGFAALESVPFTGLVATFSGAPGESAGAFQATILWGDGHQSGGSIAADPGGGFDVTGTNTYREEGA